MMDKQNNVTDPIYIMAGQR